MTVAGEITGEHRDVVAERVLSTEQDCKYTRSFSCPGLVTG